MSILINLLPWRAYARQRRLHILTGIAASACVLLTGVSAAGKMILSQKRIALQTESRALDIELGRLRGLLQPSEPEEASRQRLRLRQHRARQIARWADLLPAISRGLPPGSWLTHLSWQAGTLTIEGYSSTLDDLEHTERRLRAIYPQCHVKSGPVSCDRERGLAYAFFVKEVAE